MLQFIVPRFIGEASDDDGRQQQADNAETARRKQIRTLYSSTHRRVGLFGSVYYDSNPTTVSLCLILCPEQRKST